MSEMRKELFEGLIHKCPNCGTVVGAFQAICPDCGFEIRDRNSSTSVQDFMIKLNEIENSITDKSDIGSMLLSSWASPRKQIMRKANFISTYPVPNTKVDLIEFFLLTAENFDAKCAADIFPIGTRYGSMQEFKERKAVERAWLSKMEMTYKKAKISFGSDPSFIDIEEVYKHKKAEFRKAKRIAFTPIYVLIAFFALPFIFLPFLRSTSEIENSRLQNIVKEVEDNIQNKDYDSALLKLTTLHWTANPEYHKEDIEQWDKQRQELKKIIEDLKKQSKKK